MVFAAQELKAALKETGQEELKVTLAVEPDETSPQSFRIQLIDPNQIMVIGTDANGAMYGGLELAENLKLGIPTANVSRKPYVSKRGIKLNIPLDAKSIL